MEGTGITRIDTVLVNPAAADTIHKIYYDYIEGASFDHVPLHLLLNVSAFQDEADTIVQPTRITVRTLTGMTTKQRLETLRREAKIFERTWARHSDTYQTELRQGNIDGAHRTWCAACEEFLWELQGKDDGLPTGKPRRGQVMPTEKRCVVDTLCNATRLARNGYADKVDRVIGLASDLKGRIASMLARNTDTWQDVSYD